MVTVRNSAMKEEQPHPRRRLFWERYPPANKEEGGGYLEQLMQRVKTDGVGTVFIVSSEDVDAGEYLSLVGKFESRGFRVRNIHLEMPDETLFHGMVKVLDEIIVRFSRESCLVVSYGRSLAPLLMACYNVRSGESPSKAINRVRKIDASFIRHPEEKSFVYTFGKRIRLNENNREMKNDDLVPWREA